MGDTKLCLLLLLTTYAFAQEGISSSEEQSPTCLLASRFKNFRKYVYQYETEALNGVSGASNIKNGPKVTCKVEIDVPQTCSYIVRTFECTLSEVSDIDAEGLPVYGPAAGADDFRAAMEKNPLKLTVEGATKVSLFPEEDEPINILNIKRGIISALLVPVLEEEYNSNMATVHGLCETDFVVEAREDIATDVTVTRDLSHCDGFSAKKDLTSPLALISGLHFPLSKLISSTQTCNYKFDNKKKHMTEGTCTEKHILLPFSHQEEYGVLTLVKQSLILQETSKINDRVFDNNEAHLKALNMEAVEDKSPVQTKDAALATLSELSSLSHGKQRASLFQKLVTQIRGLKSETLSPAVPEMVAVSRALTWQALAQCGTPECSSAILQILRTMDKSVVEVDAAVYAMGLMANPSDQLVKDMLSMAQYKQSKAILYTLSNTVRRLYQAEGKLTPTIADVSEFMASLIGEDCAGDKDQTFLALRVIGNMGKAMEAADPGLKSTLLKCMRQPATTLAVQQAAIQAFRQMSVTGEVRTNLQKVFQYSKGAVQKRLAAYLILMKNPETSDLELVKKTLTQEQNEQVKQFVASHIYNILNSMDADIEGLRHKINAVMQGNEISTHAEYNKLSRNYKMAGVEGNMIFDATGFMPKEIMLETTLKAFGYELDMLEASDNIMREISRNANKLLKELLSQDSPEATAYLRIMGAELGYMKASELKGLVQSGAMYADIFSRMIPTKFLQSMVSGTDNEFFVHYIFMDNEFSLPTASGLPLKVGLSGTFAPGAKGGLQITPGMQELSFMPSIGVEFVTQMGVHIPEFVVSGIEMHTNIYHESALSAKVTMSDNQVKLTIPAPQGTTRLFGISNSLFSVTSGQTQMIPSMSEDRTDSVKCSPLFSGVAYCTTLRYSNPSAIDAAPYFPLTGETELAVDIKPTGDVTEYTATIAYELLKEGKDGRQRVDSLTMTLKAEGTNPSEARGTIKYNRNRNVFSTDIQIPDYDVECGIKFGVSDSNSRGKKITFDITNKNIPRLSLVGRAKLEAMTDGMLQVQLTIPGLSTDATITATLGSADGLTLGIESIINIPETSSQEKVILRYDESKVEIEYMSDTSSEVQKLFPDAEAYRIQLMQFIDDILDQKVAKTDMNLRHIFSKSLEAGNIWLGKFGADVPYVENLKNSLPDFTLPSVPEKLFLKSEAMLRYQFNKDHITFILPLPLGGQSSSDLNIPPTVTIPRLSVPMIGLEIPSTDVSIPTFSIPLTYELSLPLIGMAEGSAKVNTNFYNWEGSVSAGNNTEETTSYIAKYQVMAESPMDLLSYKTEGTVLITDNAEDINTLVNGSMVHKFIDASFSYAESLGSLTADRVKGTGNYKVEVSSPLGLKSSVYLTTQATLENDEVAGDANLDGAFQMGSLSASTSYTQSYVIYLSRREARGESTLRVDTPLINVLNKIKGTYTNEELSLESKTNMDNKHLNHMTKVDITYKDSKVSLKSDSVSTVIGTTLRNQVELTASTESASFRVETQADNSPNRAYALLSGSLDAQSLEMNADSSINFKERQGSHKGTLVINSDGLSTSGTTTLQYSPLTFDNVFNGKVDSNGATMSLSSKGNVLENVADLKVDGKIGASETYLNSVFKGNLFDADSRHTMNVKLDTDGLTLSNNLIGSLREMRTDSTQKLQLNFWTLVFESKTDNFISGSTLYKHDITVELMKQSIASLTAENELKILDAQLQNSGQFKLEPYVVLLTGTLKGAFREEEIRHTYEIGYADQVATMKCSTTGKILGGEMAHNTDLELSARDISSKLTSNADLNSRSLRLKSSVEMIASPSDLSINAILNTDGDLTLYGKHTGELYSKLQLKAVSSSITHTHDCRASTTHNLDSGASIETSFDNKIDCVMSTEEQKTAWTMKSKLNQHEYKQEISAYNKPDQIALELAGTILTDLLNRPASEKQEFSISGFLKYDKNSDSHIIELPFFDTISRIIRQLTAPIRNLKDSSIAWLQDFDTKYEITDKIQEKVSELKEVINSFDIKLFAEDLRNFASSINIEKLLAQIPTEKIIRFVDSIKVSIIDGIKDLEIAGKVNAIHLKVKELLEKYEVEKTIEAIIEKVSELIKQYRVSEKIKSVTDALNSIDFEVGFERTRQELIKMVSELQKIEFKKMMMDLDDFISKIARAIGRVDLEFAVIRYLIPAFGKIYSEFKLTSPMYSLKTNAELKNSTTTETPLFQASLTSQAITDFDLLAYTMKASSRIAAPKMNRLVFSESLKFTHTAFSIEHQSATTLFSGASANANSKSIVKATTDPYTAVLSNTVSLVYAFDSGISVSMDNQYNHNVNMPVLDVSSQATITQKATTKIESGAISVTVGNEGNGKLSVVDYSDEGTHKSDLAFNMDVNTAKLTFESNTDCKSLKMKQTLKVESVITLNSNAGLYNQDDIVAQFGVFSTSEFEILRGKLEGKSTLTQRRGLKLDSTVTMEHANIEGTHESTISLNRKGMDTSMSTIGKIKLPTETLEFNQEFTGNAKDGLSASVFSPSAGFLGFQLQKKSQSQVYGRLFSRYLSAPENDVEILTVKASLKIPDKLSFQTSWNTEVPYEILLGLKERVPAITSALTLRDTASSTINTIYNEIPLAMKSLQKGIDELKVKSKIIYTKAAESLANPNLQEVSRKLSKYSKYLLSQYQGNIKDLLDAVIKFLRETQFQLPWFEEKLTGIEIYQKISDFVAMVIEDAIQKVPEFVASYTKAFIELIKDTEFTMPGSNFKVSGKAVLEDLTIRIEKVQSQAVVIVRKLQAVTLEDMLVKLRDFLLAVVRLGDDFISSLTSEKMDKLLAWVNDIYSDAVNSRIMTIISLRLQEAGAAAEENLDLVKARLQDMYSQMTLENLNTILQSWIDAIVKQLNSFSNDIIEFLKQVSQNVQPYVRVSDKKIDIDIPLPFALRSSNTMPTQDEQ
ncbi:hypothetical protein AGOR_G00082150 [Albula goreensis]|uniref:Vitellogenin domain-containing protein n=1 Tax=Albula goreensis TaxID=1534307 RepID=A0A8T3DSU4_9TELE|nr:hypothetical protein AGOR_G00082150 [Albula goreensis]